ncbi:helix-turn-helix domain-containing protein [Paenibacillus sp. GCM10023248]|uniref:AraC family transcriptional regulator n=1 Tax=Bacillales TaxID=1385 RepID=UPI00237843E0|nr:MULTISPECIES: AraC family transcriptional regulator [Bacillales]MDD9272151.1 AraC family transcriptional regulator [Paenibacillus sp. MAHUQ-63]MDR6885320.1 AraC-like DNA-binding protein [Bacillus sp. 3255]
MPPFFDPSIPREFIIEERLAVYTQHDFHTHVSLEISIALDSSMKYPMGDQWYYADPGDVFLLRPFEPHWNLIREEGKPGRWIMLLFSPEYISFMPKGDSLLVPFYTKNASQVIPAASPYARCIVRLAQEALLEKEHAQPGWDIQLKTLLIQILVQIQRYYAAVSLEQSSESGALTGIIAAIEHIMTHWAEELDMDDLIERAALKKTWFYTKFREVTGMSPHEFIISLRLQYAAHMLLYTQDTITDIALHCGFGSSSYFNKVFKENRGLTPSTYRKSKPLS